MSNPKNNEELSALVSELKSEIVKLKKELKTKSKYGLTFDRKSEVVVDDCETKLPVLKEVIGKKIETDKTGLTNIIIEGDNYHSLQVLNYTHQGKIDVIYIDPPYNTGNKDFIYNDSFIDRDDGFRDSKWLSFMERRLLLARDLLSEDGVIFISIDDNEQAQLKLLCDSIFGRNNFINNFIWINNLKGRQISDLGASKTYEYILVYGVNSQNIKSFEGNINELKTISPDVYKNKNYEIFEDKKGKYVLKNELYNSNSDFNEETRPNLVYEIFYNPKTKEIKFNLDKKDKGFVLIKPKQNNNGKHSFHAWRWSKDKILKDRDDLFFLEDESGDFRIYTKIRDIYTTTIKDLITNITTNAGGKDIKDILGKKVFSFPKPKDLIKFLLKFSTKNNSIVLDFFAGSGTTGHAVLELNKETNTNRQFIICTNNGDEKSEHKIASDVCYPRIQKVIEGYTMKNKEKVSGLGGNLRYLKTTFIDKKKNKDEMKFKITSASTEILCLKEGVFDVIEEVGDEYSPTYKIVKGHTQNGSKVMGIYFDIDDRKLEEMRKKLLKYKEEKVAYIFSLTDNSLDINHNDWLQIKIEPIPEKILKVYEYVYKLSKK